MKWAEMHADAAVLRSERTCGDELCAQFTVEDELVWCLFYLWALENLEECV